MIPPAFVALEPGEQTRSNQGQPPRRRLRHNDALAKPQVLDPRCALEEHATACIPITGISKDTHIITRLENWFKIIGHSGRHRHWRRKYKIRVTVNIIPKSIREENRIRRTQNRPRNGIAP